MGDPTPQAIGAYMSDLHSLYGFDNTNNIYFTFLRKS